MSIVEFCGSTVPRPGHLLTMRRAMVVVVVAFGLLTSAAALFHDTLLRIDQPVSDAVRGWGDVEVWRVITLLGASEVYVPLALASMVVLWNRCRSLAIAWPALTLAASIVTFTAKALVDRPRPDLPDTGVSLAAYPSGHTIHATVALGLIPPTLYLLTRRSWSAWIAYPVVVTIAAIAGLSRVALGAHWLTDVVAGHLIGLALLIGADLVVELRQRDGPPRLRALHPAYWPGRAEPAEPRGVGELRR
ncbi:MAG: phosphatase PAP2 family protein [Ilumatobacteraceae bacterium]